MNTYFFSFAQFPKLMLIYKIVQLIDIGLPFPKYQPLLGPYLYEFYRDVQQNDM